MNDYIPGDESNQDNYTVEFVTILDGLLLRNYLKTNSF